jgi:hypothetical protein
MARCRGFTKRNLREALRVSCEDHLSQIATHGKSPLRTERIVAGAKKDFAQSSSICSKRCDRRGPLLTEDSACDDSVQKSLRPALLLPVSVRSAFGAPPLAGRNRLSEVRRRTNLERPPTPANLLGLRTSAEKGRICRWLPGPDSNQRPTD